MADISAIGLLAATALRLRGFEVIGVDIVDSESSKPRLLAQLGGTYVNARKTDVENLEEKFGEVDLILEAAGVAQLGFDLIDILGINGIYVMTGIPDEGKPVWIPGGDGTNWVKKSAHPGKC